MVHVDVAIVGGGLAGSTAAAMLGRSGIDAALIDPHAVYPPDFRCEKLDDSQVRLLRQTGLADAVLSRAARYDEIWIARFGQLVGKRRTTQYGVLYETLVNAVRDSIPPGVGFHAAKVAAVSTGAERQRLMLSNGDEISARLIVLANGLNSGLRRAVGMTREDLSACHSISLGFDASPLSGDAFDFPSLTYFPELTAARIAYVTLFPIGAGMRANVFVYRDSRDPWLHRLRNAPQDTLFAALPGLQRLTGDFSATNVSKIRPVDLYVTRSCRQPGVVLVGDAFSTSCPAAGTGVNKVLTDVVQLCAVHIPRWLASPGMAEEKIAAFYDDPVKRACDAQSTDKAYYLRSLSTEPGLPWRARRGPFRRPARIRPRPADGRAAIAAAGSSARRRGRRRRAVAHFRGITPAERKSRGIDVHCQGARFSYPESRRATDPPAGYRQDDLAAASCGFLRSWYDYLRVVTCARGNRPFFAFLGTT